jgi:hypothetical protein
MDTDKDKDQDKAKGMKVELGSMANNTLATNSNHIIDSEKGNDRK